MLPEGQETLETQRISLAGLQPTTIPYCQVFDIPPSILFLLKWNHEQTVTKKTQNIPAEV